MKEIRFRAWDKTAKYMFKIFDNTTGEEWFLPQVKDKFEVMQYTGLKDRNGKEIYEGDIFRITNPNSLYIVTWDEANGRFLGVAVGGVERRIAYVGMVDRNDKPAIEVIGNIYENVELISID